MKRIRLAVVAGVWRASFMLGAALLVASPAAALEGRVVDAVTGEPLAGVELSVVGRTTSARSDAAGRFVLVPAPRPPFELLATLPGGRYARPLRFESVPGDGLLVVEIAATVTESVTVTAGAAPGIRTAPASGTAVVSREDIRSRESRNLTATLQNVPGVSNVSEGHAAVPAIRGLAQARSLVLVDGARVTSERRIGPSATFLDPFVLEGVEVSRGPGSVAYGSDAFGGVILARTRRPRPGAAFGTTVAASLGAGVPQARLGVEVESGLGPRAGVLVAAHARTFGDYDSPEGEVGNSGSRDHGVLASWSRFVPGGLASVAVQVDRGRDVERPRTNSDVVRFYYPIEDSLRVTAAYESGPVRGFDSTALSLFVGDARTVTDQDRLATPTEPRSIERADVSARDFELRAGAEKHWGETRVDFGLDWNGRFDLEAEDVTVAFDAAGNETDTAVFRTIEDARRTDLGLYAQIDGALAPALAASAGLRYDRVRATNEGGYFGDVSVSRAEPSGFASLTWDVVEGLAATVQVSRGFRDARLSDRFFRGVTGAGFITGNPELEAETSEQYDVALRATLGRFRPALFAYDYRIDDLIERYEDPAGSDLFFFRNRGRARIRGLELELQAELPGAIGLHVAGSVIEGEALDDRTPLDDIPPRSVSVQLRRELGPRAWVQVRGFWAGALDEPGPTEIALDSRTVVDVSGGFRPSGWLDLRLLVLNVFDESYLLTPDDRSPLAPGTSVVLEGRFTF